MSSGADNNTLRAKRKLALAGRGGPGLQSLRQALEHRGYSVLLFHSAPSVLDEFKDQVPDALLIEVGHAGLDGLGLLLKARRTAPSLPIVVLSERHDIGDRVQILNAGADDFLGKPFDVDELDARIGAVIRRNRSAKPASPFCGKLRMDFESGAFYIGDEILVLTPREQRFLGELITRCGAVVPRDRLFRSVFSGGEKIGPQALDVVAHRARRKLGHAGVTVVTLRGLGYLLRAQSDRA